MTTDEINYLIETQIFKEIPPEEGVHKVKDSNEIRTIKKESKFKYLIEHEDVNIEFRETSNWRTYWPKDYYNNNELAIKALEQIREQIHDFTLSTGQNIWYSGFIVNSKPLRGYYSKQLSRCVARSLAEAIKDGEIK